MARPRRSRSTGSSSAASAADQPPEGGPAAAMAEAVRFLAHAARSTSEVDRHLQTRGFAAALVDATLAALRERGWVNDAAFAERRAEELLLRRGAGRLKVAYELTRRGLT